jgi:lysophospholipase
LNAIVDVQGPDLCNLPSNPVPEGARAAFFETRDKVRLRYAVWPKSGGTSRGTVCIVQGRSEFIEKYFETIADFRKRGFTVAIFDWRGQGGSERLIDNPKTGYVERFDDYWIDLASFHSEILLPDCPPPYYLVGHSMGGLVSLIAASRDRLMFDRIFLTAPMVGMTGLPISHAFAAALMEIGCFAGLAQMPLPAKGHAAPDADGFPGNILTSDHRRYMRMIDTLRARPDLEVGQPALRWVATALRAMTYAHGEDFPERVRAPVLMLAAARDEVVSTSAIEHLGLRMRTGRHAVIAASRHEMFMENDDIRAHVFAAFDAFITEQSKD